MRHDQYSRREFGRIAATAAAAVVIAGGESLPASEFDRGVKWPIGCFNRPWSPWTYDQALEGMKGAGFALTGLLGDHAGEPFLLPPATDEYIDALGERIKRHGLELNVAWLRTRHELPHAEALAAARKQIDYAARLHAKYLLTTGVDGAENYEHYYRLMKDVSAYAADHGPIVAMKPHGGCSASADEMLQTIERVNHANFRIWYDAGNIVHYTDADPVADVVRVAEHVVGVSAKDCKQRGGDVMLQFGEGKVDFRGVFAALKKAGFKGPVMVECCRGRTPAELTENARANRQFLERLFAPL